MCFKDICKNTVTGILNLKKQLPDRLFAIFLTKARQYVNLIMGKGIS